MLGCLFFEVLQLSFSMPVLVKLHAFIRVVVSKLEHSVHQGGKVVGQGRDRLGRIHAPASHNSPSFTTLMAADPAVRARDEIPGPVPVPADGIWTSASMSCEKKPLLGISII